MKKILVYIFILLLHCYSKTFATNYNFYNTILPNISSSQVINTLNNPAYNRFIINKNAFLGYGNPELAQIKNRFYAGLAQSNFRLIYLNDKLLSNKTNHTVSISKGFGNTTITYGGEIEYSSNTNDTLFKFGSVYRPTPIISLEYLHHFNQHQKKLFTFSIRPFHNKLTFYTNFYLNSFEHSYSGANIPLSTQLSTNINIYQSNYTSFALTYKLKNKNIRIQSNSSNSLYLHSQISLDKLLKKDQKIYYVIQIPTELPYQIHPLSKTLSKDPQNNITYLNLINAIKKAKTHPNLDGLIIDLSKAQLNTSRSWEIRNELKLFKQSGKKVIVYIENSSFNTYYLASIADQVIANKYAWLFLDGVSRQKTYYSETLKKLGIGIQSFQYKKYKTANETFTKNKMSKEDKEQNQNLVNQKYEIFSKAIAKSKQLNITSLNNIIKNNYIMNPNQAKKLKLIDSIADWNALKTQINTDIPSSNKRITLTRSIKSPLNIDTWGAAPTIAIVYINGTIKLNRQLLKTLDNIEKDTTIKAVIFRIDSPGGSIIGSDTISNAIKRIKKNKKIIVSQGQYAASGGYYLSMHADRIFTTPLTITGSIGVIGLSVYDNGILNKLGINIDSVDKEAPPYKQNFFFLSKNKPSTETKKIVETLLEESYNDFVNNVSIARNIPLEKVETLAQGRIWSGQDAVKFKLADEIGSLTDAINYTLEICNISDNNYKIQSYPKPKFSISTILTNSSTMLKHTKKSLNQIDFLIDNNQKILYLMPDYNF